MPNTEAALGMLKSGEINFLSDYTGDPKLLEQLVASTPASAQARRHDGTRLPLCRHERAPRALRRRSLPPRLSTAIDRRLIVGAALQGLCGTCQFGDLAGHDVLAQSEAVNDFPRPDIDKAQAILKDAGYTIEGGRLHYPDGKTETLAK